MQKVGGPSKFWGGLDPPDPQWLLPWFKWLFKTDGNGVRVTFFYERIVNPKNNLPSDTDFSSLSTFKRSVSNIDFINHLKRYWFLIVLVRFCLFGPHWLLLNAPHVLPGSYKSLYSLTPVIFPLLYVFLWCCVLKKNKLNDDDCLNHQRHFWRFQFNQINLFRHTCTKEFTQQSNIKVTKTFMCDG